MKRFSEYVVDKEKKTTNTPELSDDTIYRICKLSWRKHRKPTEEFINQMAEIDPEIKSIMSDINSGDDPVPPHTNRNGKDDEVVPPEADGSPGMEDGGGEE